MTGFLLLGGHVLQGCTLRYSRQWEDRLQKVEGPPVTRRVAHESRGLEILFFPVVEPEGAAELLKTLHRINACKSIKNAEVDYRNFVMVLVNLPQVVVSADCDQKGFFQETPKREIPGPAVPDLSPPTSLPEPTLPEPQAPIQQPPLAPGR